jgi:hypothetical protein
MAENKAVYSVRPEPVEGLGLYAVQAALRQAQGERDMGYRISEMMQ